MMYLNFKLNYNEKNPRNKLVVVMIITFNKRNSFIRMKANLDF
jgi:hypothetical protein